MDALKFQTHKNKQAKPFNKQDKGYKIIQKDIRSTSATHQYKPLNHEPKQGSLNTFKSKKRINLQNHSWTEEKNFEILTDEISKKFFKNFLKFFADESDKKQLLDQTVLKNRVSDLKNPQSNSNIFLKNERKINKSENLKNSKEPCSREKLILKKFIIKGASSKEKEKKRILPTENKKFGLDKIIPETKKNIQSIKKEGIDLDVELLQSTFNSKLISNIDRKRNSGSTKSSQQESKINLKLGIEEINTGQSTTLHTSPSGKIVNLGEIEDIHALSPRKNPSTSDVMMMINRIENFSYFPYKSSQEIQEEESVKVFNEKNSPLKFHKSEVDSKEPDKFITFSISHQSSLKEIYIKSKSRENLKIKEDISLKPDKLNLVDYLEINRSFSSLDDVSLESIDSDSINSD